MGGRGNRSRTWLGKGSRIPVLAILAVCFGGAVLGYLLLVGRPAPSSNVTPSLAVTGRADTPLSPPAALVPPASSSERRGPPAEPRVPDPSAPEAQQRAASPRTPRAPMSEPAKVPPSAAAVPSGRTKPQAGRVSLIAEIEKEIIRLTNVERSSEGLPPLVEDAALSAIARGHSRDMVARDFFSHESPDGDGPNERAEKAGYEVRRPGGEEEAEGVGENIGQVPLGTIEDIGLVTHDALRIAAAQVWLWMDSRGHRNNMLSEDYRRIGVGVAYDGKSLYVSTQLFW